MKPTAFSGLDTPLGRLASRIYGGLRHVDRLYRTAGPPLASPLPTISVGNIVVGGTGKTAMIAWLAERFSQRGLRPVVLSRGYRGREAGPAQVAAPFDPHRYGDEPVMLARRGIDVWVAKKRELALELAARDHDVILLDDGFQRIEIARDLDLVMFGAQGLGNGRLLPAGILRDPPSELARADALCGPPEHLPPLFPELPRFAFGYRGLRFLPAPPRPPVAALAAIAQPETFFSLLERQGISLAHRFALPDHDPLGPHTRRDVRRICQRKGIRTLVVTEKDAVKIDATRLPVDMVVAVGDFGPLDEDHAAAFERFLYARLAL
ncbi:MAG: tetraacyldisaccharide 4'-kinase [Candidatus Dadabacteria bacterium]|nr:MAG: tetraacyldisaccharide 4'-kinase [Candidatus Dadabacteria bacterium]